MAEELTFEKQPISPISPARGTMSSVPSSAVPSDNESMDSRAHPAPVSLLSTLLSSPDHRGPSRPSSGSGAPGMTSSHTTAPSTALSSPNGLPDSILRRESTSSDMGDAPHYLVFGHNLERVNSKLDKVEEAREQPDWQAEAAVPPKRTCSLKFAVAPSAKMAMTPAPPQHAAPLDRAPSSTYDDADDDEVDRGYEEDSESGMSDDDNERSFAWADITSPPSDFPFARPTNFGKYRSRTPSPPPAEARLPPPSRRGRGHIRVADNLSEPEKKKCSRHRSPPPTASRERAGSRGRLSDAGPREGRAGSPMPSKVFESDESDEDEPPESPIRARGGWRSDDYGLNSPNAQAKARHASAGPRLSESSASAAPSSVPMEQSYSLSGMGDGVRSFLRRASEHIPGLRRPSVVEQESSNDDLAGRPVHSPPGADHGARPRVDSTAAFAEPQAVDAAELLRQLQHTLSAHTVELDRSGMSSGGKVNLADRESRLGPLHRV